MFNRVSAYILFFAIAVAPLPFGSRDATTVAAWCFVLGLGLIFASSGGLRKSHLALLAGVGVIVACYGFVLHEQLSDHPWIAPFNPIWAKTAELLGRPVQPSVSIIRGEPFYALGPALANVLALLLGLVVGANDERARQALLVMGWSGVGYAIYGFSKIAEGPLNATFVNRNTAATYFGSCAAVWLVLLMATFRGRLPAGPIKWKEILQHIGDESSKEGKSSKERELAIRLCMLFVCLAAMFMTASRAGVIFSLFGMVIAFIVFFRRDLPRRSGLVLALVGAGLVTWVLLQLMGGRVEERIDSGGLVDQGRLAAYQSTLRIIADYPWFGTGWGTFAAIFPAYRSGNVSIWGVWDIAHSTPLELAAELGVPLASLVAAAWVVCILVLFRGTRRSRRETVAPLAALAVALIANLHSAVDFSLQVPGYAIVAFAVVGVGLGQSFQTMRPQQYRRRRHRPGAQADENENLDTSAGQQTSRLAL